MAPSMRAQLRKTYGKDADIVHHPVGHSGNRIGHFMVVHGKAPNLKTTLHHETTGRKVYPSQVWPKVKPKKSRFGRKK